MAYTLTLAAAAFTSYLLRRYESSSWNVAVLVAGAVEQHGPSTMAGEQQPDWFSTFAYAFKSEPLFTISTCSKPAATNPER